MWFFMEISFLGGCDINDNSCLYLEHLDVRILLDCGYFNSFDEERLLQTKLINSDFIIITHSHLDHSNLLPYLLMHGFNGKILSTKATRELLYQDIKKKRSGFVNYDIPNHEHQKLLNSFHQHSHALNYYSLYQINKEITLTLLPASHMLGSAQILLFIEDKQLLYTGDICPNGTLLQAPFSVELFNEKLKKLNRTFSPDIAIIESTRFGKTTNNYSFFEIFKVFKQNISEGLKNAGNLVITARCKERAQEILYLLRYLAYNEDKISPLEIVVMRSISDTTQIYLENSNSESNLSVENSIFSDILLYPPVVDQFTALRTEFGDDPQTQQECYGNGSLRVFIVPDTFIADIKTINFIKKLKNDKRNVLLITSYLQKDTNAEILLTAFNKIRKRKGLYLVNNELRILDSPFMEKSPNEYEKFDFRLTIHQMSGFPSHASTSELINYSKDLIRSRCSHFVLVHGGSQAKRMFNNFLIDCRNSILVDIPHTGFKLNI